MDPDVASMFQYIFPLNEIQVSLITVLQVLITAYILCTVTEDH